MKKVRRFVFMESPIKNKPENFNEYQGLVIWVFAEVKAEQCRLKNLSGYSFDMIVSWDHSLQKAISNSIDAIIRLILNS